jgi:tRNA(Ile)-lysidine synthase
MSAAGTPIDSYELDALFGPFAADADRPCALAVSGGSDSTALMVLFADWLAQTGRKAAAHVVVTVDHGLRAGSAAEARGVGIQAERLGFRHAVLTWMGEKPATGLQEAARGARYALIAGAMREMRIVSLFAGHTRDDQAETVLMRLARGSGVDGLSAMAARAPLLVPETDGDGFSQEILRPLLGIPNLRLRTTLASRGIAWVEDPSNARTEFERVRLRAARAGLDALGLTSGMLAVSARRLQRARTTLEDVTDAFCAPDAGNVTADPLGCITIDRNALRAAGEEIALRVLMRVVRAAGGLDGPPPYARIETIAADCMPRSGVSAPRTLARALITTERDAIVVEREPGRAPLPVLRLAPGESAMWDGRFRVSVPAQFAAGIVEVRALSEPGLMALRRRDPAVLVAGLRLRAAALVPALWAEDTLVAVPALDHWATGDRRLRSDFMGLFGKGRTGR